MFFDVIKIVVYISKNYILEIQPNYKPKNIQFFLFLVLKFNVVHIVITLQVHRNNCNTFTDYFYILYYYIIFYYLYYIY